MFEATTVSIDGKMNSRTANFTGYSEQNAEGRHILHNKHIYFKAIANLSDDYGMVISNSV